MKILQLLVAEVTDGYDCESQSSNIESENQNTASVSQEERPQIGSISDWKYTVSYGAPTHHIRHLTTMLLNNAGPQIEFTIATSNIHVAIIVDKLKHDSSRNTT